MAVVEVEQRCWLPRLAVARAGADQEVHHIECVELVMNTGNCSLAEKSVGCWAWPASDCWEKMCCFPL